MWAWMIGRGLASLMTMLRQLPLVLWLWLVLVGTVLGGSCYHRLSLATATRAAYAAGYHAAQDSAARVAPVFRDRVVVATAKTDTVWRRAKAQAARVDTLIHRVPDSIRVQVPAVDLALTACTALARDCDQLRADIVTERIARDSLALVTSSMLVATADSVKTYQRRPTRTLVALLLALVGFAGYFIGAH